MVISEAAAIGMIVAKSSRMRMANQIFLRRRKKADGIEITKSPDEWHGAFNLCHDEHRLFPVIQ